MRCRVRVLFGASLAASIMGGCDDGGAPIPASKGTDIVREDMEHPFGPAKNLRNKKAKPAKESQAEKPVVAH